MARLGWQELLIVLLIVIVLFGVGRVTKIFGELGSGIRAFREGLQSGEKKEEGEENANKAEEKNE